MPTLRELLPIAGLTIVLLSALTAAAQEKPVILVDLGHGQQFFQTEPGRETPIGVQYRGLAQYLGADLRVTTEPLSAETLKGVRTLLIFAPLVHNRGAAAPAGRIHPGLREVPYSGGRAVEGGTPFSFILEPEGTPSKMAHASWTEVPGGGRVIAMGEMMAPLFLGEVNAVRLGGAIRPNEFGPYWGKDSREFMVEIVSWLTYRMR
jgi:hypothetical protein